MEIFVARNLLILKKITLNCNECGPSPLTVAGCEGWMPSQTHGWGLLHSLTNAPPGLDVFFFLFFFPLKRRKRLFLTPGNKSRLCALNVSSHGSAAGERAGSGVKYTV